MNAANRAWATRRERSQRPAPAPRKKLTKPQPIKLPTGTGLVSSKEILAKTVVLTLGFHGFGNRRKIDPADISVGDTDKTWVHATKKLLECDQMKQIQSVFSATKTFVFTRALPHFLKEGIYLLPIALAEDVSNRIREDQNKIGPLVEAMVDQLPALRRTSKERLGEQWNPEQFPTAADLREAYYIDWGLWYVDSAVSLQTVSRTLYQEQLKKSEAAWAETRETIQQMLRAQLAQMVSHMAERLTVDDPRYRKAFREGSITKLNDFLASFDARNVVGDQQMKALVDRAKTLMKDVNAEQLRTDEAVRDYVRVGFEQINAALSTMIVDAPKRKIRLED